MVNNNTETFDALKLVEDLQFEFTSFVKTINKGLNENLNESFTDQALKGQLFTSPIVQVTPPYKKDSTIGELVEQGFLNKRFHELGGSLTGDTQLYFHQAEAIRKAKEARNIVISTGTGSGKTESFLFPIFNELFNQIDSGEISKPGVRALLLYPMNALVSDQLKRLRVFLEPFENAITFGQYVGETKETEKEAKETFKRLHPGEMPLRNELISREQMRANPPHLLITNYSMLEYLLIRPDDSSLFEENNSERWKFFVYDEAHMYDGAKAMEMALLTRRVKDRALGGKVGTGNIQCFATSATIGTGPDAKRNVSKFAGTLFGEEFIESDVLTSIVVKPEERVPLWVCIETEIEELNQAFENNDIEAFELFAKTHGINNLPSNEELSKRYCLFALMENEKHVIEIKKYLAAEKGSAASIQDLEKYIRDQDSSSLVNIVPLLKLMCRAQGKDKATLLDAKFHVFIRGLEGIFSCKHENHNETQPRIIFQRHINCPSCEFENRTSHMFEIGTCKHCGADYGVGKRSGGKISLPLSGYEASADTFFRFEEKPVEVVIDDDEIDEDSDLDISGRFACQVCIQCGENVDAGAQKCSEGHAFLKTIQGVEINLNKDDGLTQCISCSHKDSGLGVVRRGSVTQNEASMNLSTSIHQHLPEDLSDDFPNRKAGGRKTLVFSDSRQKAAEFAPNMARDYRQNLDRSLVFKHLLFLRDKGHSKIEFEILKNIINVNLSERKNSLFLPDDNGKSMYSNKSAANIILAELSTTTSRYSLERLGLLAVSYDLGGAENLLAEKFGLSKEEAQEAIFVLLDSVRAEVGYRYNDGTFNFDDTRFAQRKEPAKFSKYGQVRNVARKGWLPKLETGVNKRTDFVKRLLATKSPENPNRKLVTDLLEYAWDLLIAEDGVLTTGEDSGAHYGIDPEKIILQVVPEVSELTRCNKCARYFSYKHTSPCPQFRCEGNLVEIEQLSGDNYFANLYQNFGQFGATVKEHTAQLSIERARDVQEGFIQGNVNILSCSTTFEVGVDVGDVFAVMMRNVPPTTANYIQRSGRAARRAGSQAVVATFVKNASHDYHFFNNPLSMVSGDISAPILQVSNEAITRRHVYSLALSKFLRSHEQYEEKWKYAGEIAGWDDSSFSFDHEHSLFSAFRQWVENSDNSFLGEVERVLADFNSDMAIDRSKIKLWLKMLFEEDSEHIGKWLLRAVENLEKWNDQLLDEGEGQEINSSSDSIAADRRKAAAKEFAQSIRNEPGLAFLGNNGVIPKYGFPIDIVELRTSGVGKKQSRGQGQKGGTQGVRLQRELSSAIREYAPGCSVVADGSLYTSIGLNMPPANEGMPRWAFGHCESCGKQHFNPSVADSYSPTVDSICDCGEPLKLDSFIVPIYGFASKKEVWSGYKRRNRTGKVEFHFQEFDESKENLKRIGRKFNGLDCEVVQGGNAWVIVTNQGANGNGFYLCDECGRLEAKPSKSHTRPSLNSEKEYFCTKSGKLPRINLGYRFMTDALTISFDYSPTAVVGDENLCDVAESISAALLSALPTIEISPDDVGASQKVQDSRIEIQLYDTFPGGAGHSKRIEEFLDQLFGEALKKVDECSCGMDSSCYSCLRSYRNQFHHDRLKRSYVLSVLKR